MDKYATSAGESSVLKVQYCLLLTRHYKTDRHRRHRRCLDLHAKVDGAHDDETTAIYEAAATLARNHAHTGHPQCQLQRQRTIPRRHQPTSMQCNGRRHGGQRETEGTERERRGSIRGRHSANGQGFDARLPSVRGGP